MCCLHPTKCQETAAELEGEAADEAAEEMEGEEAAAPLSTRDILIRAVAKMGAGIALCAVFSDPLVDALSNLSRWGLGYVGVLVGRWACVYYRLVICEGGDLFVSAYSKHMHFNWQKLLKPTPWCLCV